MELNPIENEEKKYQKEETLGESFWEILRFLVFALIIVIPIRLFIAQPFIVSGTSMVPTFQDGEYLIVDEISYRFAEPERGDVVVFRYPRDPKKFFIKRLIGLPGETIDIQGSTVKIINESNPDGFLLEEPYVENISKNNLTIELNEGQFFVMGDNRLASSDSRSWGPLEKDYIIGKAFIRLFPITDASIAPGMIEKFEIEKSVYINGKI